MSVLSVPQLMVQGIRILLNNTGNSVFTQQPQIQVAPSFSNPTSKVPVSTIRVDVSSADRSSSVTVYALFSTAVEASTISEPLAERLGIKKGNSIIVSGYGSSEGVANLPSRHVDVECMDVVTTTGQTVVPKSTRVAFLIMPHPGNDMVLGMDWFSDLAELSGRNVVLDFAPDKGRLRFLPSGVNITSNEALNRFAQDTDIDEGDFISVPWSRPDPGPRYDPSSSVHDMSHHVSPQGAGRMLLDAIRDAE